MTLTGRQFSISAGEHEATIVEVGAGLRRYAVGGVDVTGTYGDDSLPPKGCGGVLVPWPNRLRGGRYRFEGVDQQLALTEPLAGNAIHGLGRWARWTAVAHEPAAVTMALDLVPQTGWPFEVSVEVRYAVSATTGLTVTASAHNHGVGRAPFGAGFHPYISTGGQPLHDTRLLLPARRRLVLDGAQVPVGMQSVAGTTYDFRRGRRLRELRLDDGFTGLRVEQGRGFAEVRYRGGGARMWFDETYQYLQVFTLDAFATDRPAIALEPMTCAPDAFNSGDGLIVLEPGGTWRGSWGIVAL